MKSARGISREPVVHVPRSVLHAHECGVIRGYVHHMHCQCTASHRTRPNSTVASIATSYGSSLRKIDFCQEKWQ
jgi:hypothetical protein